MPLWHAQVPLGEDEPLAVRALRLLAQLDHGTRPLGSGVALTRLAKALDVAVSVLLREFTLLGAAQLGSHLGPGWVRVRSDDSGRWLAWITPAGRAAVLGPAVVPARARVWRTSDSAEGESGEPSEPGEIGEQDEWVAEERPVALEYNGISHAVMLATPCDLEDFALGFSITEGLVDEPGDLLDMEVDEREGGTVLSLRITARCEVRLKQRRRTLAGRTGCGLCGTDSLDQVRRPDIAPVQPRALQPLAVDRAVRELSLAQTLQSLTGGVHAAAWCDADGALCLVREDVGRHNALDKLVGAMHRQRVDPATGFVLVTSRASFEMVQKAAVAGVGLLVAMSAPTSLAVRMAAELGLTLAGFARNGRVTQYRPG